MTKLERLLCAVLVAAIVCACVIVLEKSVRFIGIAPFLNVDDSIPNVAVTLASRGRYGFLAAPTQGMFEVDRTHAFFNYGPLYFWLAAAVSWIIGPSLVAFRMLHPIGLVVIVAVAAATLHRLSWAAVALFATLLFRLYFMAHWPLARPDIVVSMCAACMFFFMGRAISGSRWPDWFAAGFFAGSALTTHQIAAAMVPAAGVAWLWSVLAEPVADARRFSAARFRSLAALVAGGLAAAAVYVIAIDFRVGDLLALGGAGVATFARPFTESLAAHYEYGWSSFSAGWLRFIWSAFAIAAVLAFSAPWLNAALRRNVLAWVVPPLVSAALYQISLGLYGNTHTGYVILSQVSTLWAVASVVGVGLWWVRESSTHLPVLGGVTLAALVVAIAGTVMADVRWQTTPGLWEGRAPGNAVIEEYVQHAVAPLPQRASVGGSLFFGLDSGKRLDLVQIFELFPLIGGDRLPERRAELAPEYMLLSSYENDIDFVRYLAGEQGIVETFTAVFPSLRYRLVHMAYAPPYGVARAYEQAGSGSDSESPTVAVNDGTGRQWSGKLSEPLVVEFTDASPVTANVSLYGLDTRRNAIRTVTGVLPEGIYAVDVQLERPASSELGFVLPSTGRYFFWRGGWTDFAIPAAPYLPGDDHVTLLIDHPGGELLLSRFENAPRPKDAALNPTTFFTLPTNKRPLIPRANSIDARERDHYALSVRTVRRIDMAAHQGSRAGGATPPPWREWTSDAPMIQRREEEGQVLLTGSAGAESRLLESPPIRVEPHARFALTLPARTDSGAVEVGVLGPGGGWLAGPTLMPRRVVFDTREATDIRIALLNSSLGSAVPLDVRVSVPTISRVAPPSLYIDALMACRSPYIPDDPSDCARR